MSRLPGKVPKCEGARKNQHASSKLLVTSTRAFPAIIRFILGISFIFLMACPLCWSLMLTQAAPVITGVLSAATLTSATRVWASRRGASEGIRDDDEGGEIHDFGAARDNTACENNAPNNFNVGRAENHVQTLRMHTKINREDSQPHPRRDATTTRAVRMPKQAKRGASVFRTKMRVKTTTRFVM